MALGCDEEDPPNVCSLHVTSRIAHRYACTVVCCRLANLADKAREAHFSLVLPETAFISSFVIETEGKVYESYVREKEEAKQEYNAAIAVGRTAAHVAVSARHAHAFDVSANVAPKQELTFTLTYEELLTRRLGAYTHAVHVAPGQVVQDLRVEVLIEENRKLTTLRQPVFRLGDTLLEGDGDDTPTPGVVLERLGAEGARMLFAPTPQQQREIAAASGPRLISSPEGLEGRLVIQYDVERDSRGGEVLLDEGHFVHFFAPDDLPPLPKHVIFVLDLSSSMMGRKLEQLKEAMFTILDDLRPVDYFNIIEFHTLVRVCNFMPNTAESCLSEFSEILCSGRMMHSCCPSRSDDGEVQHAICRTFAFPASAKNVQNAKKAVNNMQAEGSTNIYDALYTALELAVKVQKPSLAARHPRPESIVIFLTDGQPTAGETRPRKILQMVCQRNEVPRVALFNLAFGADADLHFLKRLSLRNAGFARRIYEASDAALQLRDFYREVASPLLSKVSFQYAEDAVETHSTTRACFPTYFAGSELVVAGRWARTGALKAEVLAKGEAGKKRFVLAEPFVLPSPSKESRKDVPSSRESRKGAPSLERLWAYLSVRQLLEECEAGSELENQDDDRQPEDKIPRKQQKAKDTADAARKRALALALQYSFVTPLTSLVVVKPEGTNAADLQVPSAPPFPDFDVSRRCSLDSNCASNLLPSAGITLHSAAFASSSLDDDFSYSMACEKGSRKCRNFAPKYKMACSSRSVKRTYAPPPACLPGTRTESIVFPSSSVIIRAQRYATVAAVFILAMSVLVIALCAKRLVVNASNQDALGDLYYGVRAAYCAVLGAQVAVGLLTIVLLCALCKSDRFARFAPRRRAWVVLPWVTLLTLTTALEAVVIACCHTLSYKATGTFEPLEWAEATSIVIRTMLNVLAIYIVVRFYKLTLSG